VVFVGYSDPLPPNKTDPLDITEILLKVALKTITITPKPIYTNKINVWTPLSGISNESLQVIKVTKSVYLIH
jgi:hypothetical protein